MICPITKVNIPAYSLFKFFPMFSFLPFYLFLHLFLCFLIFSLFLHLIIPFLVSFLFFISFFPFFSSFLFLVPYFLCFLFTQFVLNKDFNQPRLLRFPIVNIIDTIISNFKTSKSADAYINTLVIYNRNHAQW